MPFKYKDMEERLMFNSVLDIHTGCWVWTGQQDGRNYGKVTKRVDGRVKTFKAHRIAYAELVGPIPDGFEIDHKCYNTLCINPQHLEPVPQPENLRRRRYD